MAVFIKIVLIVHGSPAVVKITDVFDKECIKDGPKDSIVVGEGPYYISGAIIRRIELRQYTTGHDKGRLYSLITAYMQVDSDTVEIAYDEGYMNEDALERTAKFLTEMLGLSALIQRALLSRRAHLPDIP